MPLIQVTLATGRTPEQLAALGEALTRAVEKSIGAKPESVRVVLNECDPEHWFVGGTSMATLRAAANADRSNVDRSNADRTRTHRSR